MEAIEGLKKLVEGFFSMGPNYKNVVDVPLV